MDQLRFEDVAPGRCFHAALVMIGPRSRPRVTPHAHHDFFEFVAVEDGKALHRTDRGEVEITAGDLLLIRPGDRHGLLPADDDGVTFINVAISAAWWRAVSLAAKVSTATLELQPEPPITKLTITGRHAARAALRLFDEHTDPLELLEIWSKLLRGFLESDGLAALAPSAPDWMLTAFAQFDDPEALREGVGALVRTAAVSPSHLSRELRRHLGCTPTEWVTERRLERARVLLATTTLPIGRIGAECGFGSDAYFSRCFAARFAMSPREFRSTRRNGVAPSQTSMHGLQARTG